MSEPERGACEGCGYPDTVVKDWSDVYFHELKRLKWHKPTFFLCGLCTGTVCGSAAVYPKTISHENKLLLRSMCYIGNVILESIKVST